MRDQHREEQAARAEQDERTAAAQRGEPHPGRADVGEPADSGPHHLALEDRPGRAALRDREHRRRREHHDEAETAEGADEAGESPGIALGHRLEGGRAPDAAAPGTRRGGPFEHGVLEEGERGTRDTARDRPGGCSCERHLSGAIDRKSA